MLVKFYLISVNCKYKVWLKTKFFDMQQNCDGIVSGLEKQKIIILIMSIKKVCTFEK